MKNNQERQEQLEQVWADYFIDYINDRASCRYSLSAHDNKETPDWADVDAKAVPADPLCKPYYLQLTRDVGLGASLAGGELVPGFSSDNVLGAIEAKMERYDKQGVSYDNIVLIVQGTMNEAEADALLTDDYLVSCRDNRFKAIYYMAPKDVHHEHIGEYYVRPIKPLVLF